MTRLTDAESALIGDHIIGGSTYGEPDDDCAELIDLLREGNPTPVDLHLRLTDRGIRPAVVEAAFHAHQSIH